MSRAHTHTSLCVILGPWARMTHKFVKHFVFLKLGEKRVCVDACVNYIIPVSMAYCITPRWMI